MRLTAYLRLTRYVTFALCGPRAMSLLAGLCLALGLVRDGMAQTLLSDAVQLSNHLSESRLQAHRLRAMRFLGGRALHGKGSAAAAMEAARRQHAAMVRAQATGSLSASWQAVGPNQIASAAYGNVTGRVTAIAIDPADTTGNTVYLGTTGGGVWKSTNAAGASGSVSFTPLTDTLPAFSPNFGTSAIPSLSIGAISVQNGIVLAGTGDPNDATDSYYGSGLLRSADGGLTWTLIPGSKDGVVGNHSFVGLGVAGFAWSSTTSGLVVAAISDALEGDLVGAADPINSVRGLYYSTDAGVTWQMSVVKDGSQTVQTPLPTGGNVGGNAATSVVWNPVRQLFYAAVRYHGYYESADGVMWTRMAQQPGASLSLAACPTNPGTTGNPSCPIFRGALAVQPVTGDTFALTVDSSNVDQGLWQDACAYANSACGGADGFGTQLVSAPLEVGNGSSVIPQADYNFALSAVASGVGTSSPDTVLFVGTGDLYRCSLGAGCSLRNTTNATNGCAAPAGVAGAQHAVAAMATSGLPLVYVGNDGGVWRSTDGVNEQGTLCSPDDANHFQNLNGGLGSLTEVVSFAQHPTDTNTLLVGAGANGSAGTSTAGTSTAWAQLSAGEGGTVAIDPANPMNWYVSTAAGVSIGLCSDGAGCGATNFAGAPTIGLTQVSDDASLIDPPWILDPALPSDVLIGTCRMWRGPGTSGAPWSLANAISPMFSGAQNSACDGTNGMIRSMAVGGPVSGATAAPDAGSTVLYAGMAGTLDGGGTAAGGHLFYTSTGASASSATVWTDLTGSSVTNGSAQFNQDGYDISSLVVDPHDATGATIYATVMGFGVPHVYRSTDAGAHWTNISRNLPSAPANSLVVDPNDANTLYVALDTGVYVTSAVTTCATTNCWSVYGLGLPNAPVVELAVASAMATGDGRTGELRAGTYGRGIWEIPLLTAVSLAKPAMSLSPASLTFSAQAVGTASAEQSVTVTNTGNAALTVSHVTIAGGAGIPIDPTEQDFNETDTCTTAPIAVNASCTVEVVFLPIATGARSGVLTVYGNVAGGQATAALSGTGTTAATMVLDPVALSFPATVVGATSAAENVTISNTGGTAASLQVETVTGDFRISANTCGATLGASAGCTVAIEFVPTVSGTRSGTLTVTDSVGTQTASLTGSATLPATDVLSPLTLTFSAQQLGTTSAVQQVTLTNSGDVALTLIAAQITSGDFSVVNGCGNSLNAHSSCSLAVSYVPKNVGNEVGTLVVSDQYRSQTVGLSGVGLAPAGVSLAPTLGLSFAALGVGITSAGQTVTLTNNGGVPLTLSGFTLSGDFAVVPGSNTCGTSVAVNSACTMQIAFVPTAAGVRTGVLTVTDSAASSPQTLALTGIGVDFSLTAGNSSASVASGQSAVYSLLLTSASGVPGSATFTCSGAPANATCLIVPTTVALGNGTATVVVTVATGVASASVASGSNRIWVVLLLPFGLGMLGWRSRRSLAGIVILCGLVAGIGCGSGRVIPISGTTGSPTSPTPSGASTIVVSASSAGLVRTVDLTLTVQ
ncbi:choice-of-anchor D domain-containing protein [Granulicella arctica]|uniref:Choice-of-anchor D domain-containing protein n=1 Tax=Granulicella arctica TaxID=940613 RepID=A0A7Y9PEV5_9BACT|nr:choice-of-anchor D domain-containing protein [Granulicella arctica]NYF78512.1 hypothetical protein [Granulicella arctica]